MNAEAYEKVMRKLRDHQDKPVLDGAVNQRIYQLEDLRILWVLREHHKGDEAELRTGWDYREFVDLTAKAVSEGRKEGIYSRWKRTLGPIAVVSHGLLQGYSELGDWATDWPVLIQSLRRIAILNINKDGGDTRVKWSRLLAAAAKYSEVIIEQIRCLAPNVVICAGTYEITIGILRPDIATRPLPECIDDSGRLIIGSLHPNQRRLTRREYFASISEQVRSWREKSLS